MSNKIIIYTKDYCPYCVKAKNLFKKKGLEFEEVDVSSDEIKEEMIKKANGRMTVPQIFVNENHIGGCDDLYELDRQGKFDSMLTL